MSVFKPMLAATIKDVKQLKFPLLASPKLDGIRAVILNGKAVTRSLKPIPNNYIRKFLEANALALDGLDGELMVEGDFNNVQSAVMREEGEPNFYYAVFDYHNDPTRPYAERLMKLSLIVTQFNNQRVREVPQITMNNSKDVDDYEVEVLCDGYEGLIIRSLDGTYKYGRSTLNEAKLMKLKRFEDAEATIYGIEPLYENNNAATTNALGRTERSSHKENLVAQDMLGAFNVCMPNGKCFSIGTGVGLTDDLRKELWRRRKELINTKVKYKYQQLSADGIPRFPVWLAMRDERDM